MGALATLRDNVVNLFRSAPAEARSSLFVEQAVDQFNLSIFATPADPDEVLKKANLGRDALRNVMTDDEVTTAYDTRVEALLAVPWRLEPVGSEGQRLTRGKPGFPPLVDWVWGEFEPFAEQVLRACHAALPYGYSVQEALYKRTALDGGATRITWSEITEKPFEWFIPALDGTVRFKTRNNPLGIETDPLKYILTARAQTYRQPFGDAIFTRLYWPVYFRKQGWRFWVRCLERFGTPMLLGKAGSGDTKAMLEKLAVAVNGATVAVGKDDEVTAVDNAVGSHFAEFERAVCARIQKLLLGQTLTTDSGGSSGTSGSYALGQVHNEVRIDRRNADVRMVTKSVQRAVDIIWQLNNFDGPAPRFVMGDATGLERERADRDAVLANADICEFTDEYVMRVYDVEPGDIVSKAERDARAQAIAQGKGNAQPPAPGDSNVVPFPRPARASIFAATRRFTPQQQTIEDALALVLPQFTSPIPDQQIRAAIAAAKDPADLIAQLAVLLRDLDPHTQSHVVELALYAADLTGYTHAQAPLSQQSPPPEQTP